MKRVITFLKTNGLLSLLGLCLAWMIWVQISVVFVETKEITIDVEVLPEPGEDMNAVFIHGWNHEQVTVKISGSRRVLDGLDSTNLKAVFRARAETVVNSEGLQARTFTEDDLEMPDGIRLLSMSPRTVVARIAKYAKARVRIKVDTDVSRVPADASYELRGSFAIPAMIDIEGPASLVTELTQPETGGIATIPIEVQNHPPSVRFGDETEIRTTVDLTVPLDIAALEERGLRPRVGRSPSVREVGVRLQFAHVHRVEDVMIPFDVHWVNPDGSMEKPTFFQVNLETSESIFKRVPGTSDYLISVTLVGPRELLVGEALEKTKAKLRGFVRADAKRIEQLPDQPSLEVFFEGVPDGIAVEPIPLARRPTADPKPFLPEKNGD